MPATGERLAVGPDDPVVGERDLGGRATERCRRLARSSAMKFCVGVEQRRTAHHHRARMIGAVAVADIGGRAVDDTWLMRSIGISSASAAIWANTVSTPCPTADEPMNTVTVPPSLISSRARLLRAGGAALDEAADREAVIAAVDQPALQLRLVGPAEFVKAAVERRLA